MCFFMQLVAQRHLTMKLGTDPYRRGGREDKGHKGHHTKGSLLLLLLLLANFPFCKTTKTDARLVVFNERMNDGRKWKERKERR